MLDIHLVFGYYGNYYKKSFTLFTSFSSIKETIGFNIIMLKSNQLFYGVINLKSAICSLFTQGSLVLQP